MYLYFDKLGVLKTIIPHGEIPRQGSTLNIYVCFDEDFFENLEEQQKHQVNVDLTLPNNETGTKNMITVSDPKLKLFMPVSSSEVTYDFIPGVEYLTYHFKFEPEQSTIFAGRVIANVSVVNLEEDNENTVHFGRAEIFVEKTFGDAKLVVNEASLHYKNLVKQINQLNTEMAKVNGLNVFTNKNIFKNEIEINDSVVNSNVVIDAYGNIKLTDGAGDEYNISIPEKSGKIAVTDNNDTFEATTLKSTGMVFEGGVPIGERYSGKTNANIFTELNTFLKGIKTNTIQSDENVVFESSQKPKWKDVSGTLKDILVSGDAYSREEIDNSFNEINSKIGAANGIATLNESGKIPSSQLPSYVDDVVERNNLAESPEPGETGKIYVDLITNRTYRWGGTTYVEISQSLALGETESTAYSGAKGKANADAIAVLQSTIGEMNTLLDKLNGEVI